MFRARLTVWITLFATVISLAASSTANADITSIIGLRTVFDFTLTEFQPNMMSSGRAYRQAGPVRTIARHPRDVNELTIATTGGGLFRSNDGGTTWRHLDGLPTNFTKGVAYDPNNPSVMIATSMEDFRNPPTGGIWRSSDRGETWSQPETGRLRSSWSCNADLSAFAIAFDPSRVNKIFVASNCGILTSIDDGATWTKAVPGGGDTRFAAVFSTNGDRILAGGASGIYSSTDGGGHWVHETTGIAGMFDNDMHGFAKSPFNSAHVFAVTQDRNVYESTSGLGWRLIAPPETGESGCGGTGFVKAVRTPASSIPDGGGSGRNWLRLYVSSRCAVYWKDVGSVPGVTTSFDFSGDWHRMGPCHDDTHDMALSGSLAGLIATDGGVEKSLSGPTDGCRGGSSWRMTGGAIGGLGALQMADIAGQQIVDSAGSALRYDLYLGTMHDSLWSSSDNGETWSGRADWENGGFALYPRIQERDVQVTYSTCWPCGNHIAGSQLTDQRDWSNPNPSPWGTPVLFPITSDPVGAGNYVQHGYEGSPEDAASNHGLYLTRNSGARWSRVVQIVEELAGPPHVVPGASPVVYQGIKVPGSPDRFALVQVSSVLSSRPVLVRPRMIYSTSCPASPATTATVNLGFFAADWYWYPVFEADPANPNHLLAADVANMKMVESFDGGDCWQPRDDLTRLVTDEGRLQMATNYNSGGNSLLPTVAPTIVFNPNSPNLVLVGTQQNGVFLSTDSGRSWRAVSNSRQITGIKNVHWQSGDTVLISSYGRGLWKLQWRVSLRPIVIIDLCRPIVCVIRDRVTLHPITFEQASFDAGMMTMSGHIADAAFLGDVPVAITTTPGAERLFFDAGNKPSLFARTVKLQSASKPVTKPSWAQLGKLAKGEVPIGILLRASKTAFVVTTKREPTYGELDQAALKRVPGLQGDYLANRPSVSLVGDTMLLGYPILAGNSKLRLSGRGFKPGEPLQVAGGDKVIQVSADAKGEVRMDIQPSAQFGRHQIEVGRLVNGKLVPVDRAYYAVKPRDAD